MCSSVVCILERKLRLMKIVQIFRKSEVAKKETLRFTLVNSNVYDALKENNLTQN